MSKNTFPDFPLRFLPKAFDAGDLTALDSQFDDLEQRPLKSSKAIEGWLLDFSELAAAMSQEEAKRYIAMTCRTDDTTAEERYLSFQRDVLPRAKPRWQSLKRRFVDTPARAKLSKKRYSVLDRMIASEVRLFRDENVPLETRDAELAQQYQKIMGAMTVTYDGQERTLQQMGRYLEVTDAKVRKEAWELVAKRYLQDRDAIDGLYDEMVRLRDRIATNAGYANYLEYAFPSRGRFDYAPKNCVAYHDAVEHVVVPELRKLHERRRRLLKQPTLRPWDLNVDPRNEPPLRPFEKADALYKGILEIYRRVSPDLAKTFAGIHDRGNMDLESRKGKAPGGYNYPLDVDRVPFIFMNAAGLHRDVQTLMHEGGHAYHTILARREPLVHYRWSPTEFAEVASQGMEMIGQEHLDVFYSAKDAARARRRHLEDNVALLAWVAQIDSFQHWVYTDPHHSREDRRRAWLDLRNRFRGSIDWDGCEEAHGSMWHRQTHLFGSPFYYIEYAISLIGALQLWLNARKNRAQALKKYRAALALGGSRPLPELFETAGLKFDFGEKTVGPLVKAMMKEIDALS